MVEPEFKPMESDCRVHVLPTMLLPDCPPNVYSLPLILLYRLAKCRIIESHVLEIKRLGRIKTFIGSFITTCSPFHPSKEVIFDAPSCLVF